MEVGGAHLNPFYLQHLELGDRHLPITADAPTEDAENIEMAPFLNFRRLETVILTFSSSINITPKSIASIPGAWPQTHNLNLLPSTPIQPPPSVDHAHLLQLVASLPLLRTLGLRFDATKISGHERGAGHPFALRRLTLTGTPLRDPFGVASFLEENFPSLQDLDFGKQAKGSPPEERQLWATVSDILCTPLDDQYPVA